MEGGVYKGMLGGAHRLDIESRIKLF